MSDFINALIDLLPEHCSLKSPSNELRKVLDYTVGEWFDNRDIQTFYDNLFINTATGKWLDLFGKDYNVTRQADENDDDFRNRIVQEKNDHLIPSYLEDLYGLKLYKFIPFFDATSNQLTSDNVYIAGLNMAERDSNVESILNRKFIMDNELVWIDDNKIKSYMDIPVNIIFDDNDNGDGNRPASVTVNLYVGGNQIDSETVSSSTNWKCTFENLPIYNNDGSLKNYTVGVDSITDYTSIIDGFNIYCGYTPETISYKIIKTWDDNNDEHEVRPSHITVNLYNGEVKVRTYIISSDMEWNITVAVPVRINGESADYNWVESTILNYQLIQRSISGNEITFKNKYYVQDNPVGV